MSYTNVYPSRINWENEPSIASPINATNLNKMDYALYQIDQTLETWDVTKANQSDLLLSVKSIDYDTDTGVFVFTWQNGTTKTVDLNIEKIPVSFSMDANGVITMTTDDGTTYTADVGALIKTYTFTDSSVIDFSVTTDASGNKTVTADIVDGSITGTKLQPNYLADCQSAANSASGSATAADGSAEDSEAWAVGTRDGVPVPSTDPAYENNAKYYAEHGTGSSLAGLTDTDITSPTDGQVLKYNNASGKWENGTDAGGAQIDDTTTALDKVWSSSKVSTVLSNPNLLDNPWFTVNQRGFTTQTSTVAYTVDRWKQNSAYGTVTLGSDGCISLNNTSGASNLTFIQYLPSELISSLVGKTVTLSVLLKDGTLLKNTATNLDFTQNAFYALIPYGTSSGISLRSPGNGTAWIQFAIVSGESLLNIKAVKLEIGTVSTLAMDTAPNQATELLKCQRYFIKIKGSNTYGLLSEKGFVYSANQARVPISLPASLRTTPTITFDSLRLAGISSTLSTNISSITLSTLNSNSIWLLVNTSNTLTVGDEAMLSANNTSDAYLSLSADL